MTRLLRPRLAFLLDLLNDLVGAPRAGRRREAGASSARASERRRPATGDAVSAQEMKRRLEASRERLKRETPPQPD